MKRRVDQEMPKGPPWLSKQITLPDAPDEPQTFYYRDPVQLSAFLLGNPTFASLMQYEPMEVFKIGTDSRVFHEMWTGKRWNELQVSWLVRVEARTGNSLTRKYAIQLCLPPGATIVPLILGSDKTMLTSYTGGKSMHPIFLTTGNHPKEVRKNISSGATLLLAEIPTPSFSLATKGLSKSEAKKRAAHLRRILFHLCMYVVLEPLRQFRVSSSASLTPMIDASGAIRMCFPTLMLWSADLEEQNDLLGLSRYQSPKSVAGYHDLDAPLHTSADRTGESILKTLAKLRSTLGPDADTWTFQNAAKHHGLSGVERLCWEGLDIDMCRVVCLDSLHTLHKAFHDHIMKWTTCTIGEQDLNPRVMAQPHRTGERNFKAGLSKEQIAGRDHKDEERFVLPASAGHENASPNFLRCLSSSLDFIYTAQYPMHSDETLDAMDRHLETFWSTRKVFIQNGARSGSKGKPAHFRIPKLEYWQHARANIEDVGTLDNGSTEPIERLHIEVGKNPFKKTNRTANYRAAIITINTRLESLNLFTGYIQYCLGKESPSIDNFFHDLEITPELLIKDPLPTNGNVVVAKRAHLSRVSPNSLVEWLAEVDPISCLVRFFVHGVDGSAQRVSLVRYGLESLPSELKELDVWFCFKLKSQPPNEFYKSNTRVIRGRPSFKGKPALFDTVLVKTDGNHSDLCSELDIVVAGTSSVILTEIFVGYRVAEVCFIFQTRMSVQTSPSSLSSSEGLYAFVLWFGPISAPMPHTRLQTVSKSFAAGVRIGGIVKLESIKYACALAPVLSREFESPASTLGTVNEHNVMEKFDDFYVNCFNGHVDYELFRSSR